MYIMSTNLYVDSSDYTSSVPASVISSEKYFNCENFYTDIYQKRRKLFQRKQAK